MGLEEQTAGLQAACIQTLRNCELKEGPVGIEKRTVDIHVRRRNDCCLEKAAVVL